MDKNPNGLFCSEGALLSGASRLVSEFRDHSGFLQKGLMASLGNGMKIVFSDGKDLACECEG